MLSLNSGSLLSFEGLTRDTIPGQPNERPSAEADITQARDTRLSTCNFRLSFGDLDQGGSPLIDHHGRGRHHGQGRHPETRSGHLSHLGKYDKLMLKGLYCYKSIETSSRLAGGSTIENESRTIFDRRNHQATTPSPCSGERLKVRTLPSQDSQSNGEEFLIIRDNYLVRGRGIEGKYRVVDEVHRKEKPIIDSVWCTFRHRDRAVKPEHATITPVLEPFHPVDALCIAEQRTIHIHRENGERYSYSSAFPIRRLHSFPLGLLVERDTKVASNLTSVLGYPNVFSATTHLEELAPVLFLGNARSEEELSVLIHPESVVTGVGDELPLVMFFEPQGNVHSLWLARPTTAEEMEAAVELIGKEHPLDGETLHFHGSCESPRLRSRTKSAPMFTAGSAISSFTNSPGITPPLRPLLLLNESSRKNHSLHREVLLASGRKFPLPESASTPSVGNFSGKFGSPETPEASGLFSRIDGSNKSRSASSSAVVSMDMSTSMSASKLSSLAITHSRNSHSLQSSPNAPAHTLRDIRSPAMSLTQSKINSLPMESRSDNATLSFGQLRQHRSNSFTSHSQRQGKKLTRVTHTSPSTQPITDELAFPKLTFVHVWTDTPSSQRHKASRDCFQLVDCFRRSYFCFLASGQQELRCIRLRHEVLEDGENVRISADSVACLPAISAVKLNSQPRDVMAVLHPSHNVKIYASPTLLILLIDLTSLSPHDIGVYIPPFNPTHNREGEGEREGPTTSSPQTSKGHLQPVFNSHFSPVPETTLNTPIPPPSLTTKITSLTPCSGMKFLTETAVGAVGVGGLGGTVGGPRVLRLPQRPSSDVMEMCVDALRVHIDVDLFALIYGEVWKVAFEEKRKSVTLQDRWNGFFTAVLAKLACSVRLLTEGGGGAVDGSPWSNLLRRMKSSSNGYRIVVDRNVPYCMYSPAVLLTLHLVLEEVQLYNVWQDELHCMLPWMRALSQICDLPAWTQYYTHLIDTSTPTPTVDPLSITVEVNGMKRPSGKVKPLPPQPPCLLTSLEDTLRGGTAKFPVAECVNPLSRKVLRLAAALSSLNTDISEEERLRAVTVVLAKEDFILENFHFLPKRLQIAFRHVFSTLCAVSPFETLPVLVYEIAQREDAVKCKSIVSGECAGDFSLVDARGKPLPTLPECVEGVGVGGVGVGVEGVRKKAQPLPRSLITKRFANDARVREAERLLVTSEPVVIPLNPMHAANEVEFRKSQESWLKGVATRTMALPVARGMLSLGSEFAYATEKLNAPEMVFSGVDRTDGRNVTLKADDLPNGHENWPRFHNGVATGLRLRHYRHDSVKFDHHWLAFNANQQTKRESVDYAGMFLGMALNGLIDSNTDPVELHNLLVRLEDPVSIAVILGMACVKRGSQDKRYYRMISLHIITFVPDSGIELVIPQNIHVASLLSLGLLYRGSANRFISERLLGEIWSCSTADINGEATAKEGTHAERESTSLAAAFGLGFVLLGLGNESILGLADLAIPQRLRTLMTGGLHGKSNTTNKRTEGNINGFSPPKSRDMDEQSINTHITAPGAILALAMIFMKTERKDVAEWMAMPLTLNELDEIRPDFLLLRVVARSLIMWSKVEATDEWVNTNFPKWILRNVFLSTSEMEKQEQDVVSLTQAYFYILAGCCMSLGLKYAGTASSVVKDFLLKIVTRVSKWVDDVTVIRRCSQSLIQTCLTTVLVAVASVMAGTGDLEVFRVLRYMHGRPRGVITYGHQMGVHMGIGLLFLGSGMFTLGTSCEAVGGMLVAFYPMWPKNAGDNRYHLQAFRHLYVLAVENRLVTTRSIHDGRPVQTTVRVEFLEDLPEAVFITPCVLPELTKLKKISIASGRHWLIFTGHDDWDSLKKLLLEEGIVVYPPSGTLRTDNLSLTLAHHSHRHTLLGHFDRLMTHPVDSRKEVVEGMKKFLRECTVVCPERGVAGLFEVAGRGWMHGGVHGGVSGGGREMGWMAWVIYQSAVHEEWDAWEEIVACSGQKGKQWQTVMDLIVSLCADRSGQKDRLWKLRLRKDVFLKNFDSAFSSFL